jgi:hypothetical protein
MSVKDYSIDAIDGVYFISTLDERRCKSLCGKGISILYFLNASSMAHK